jgi:adenylate cyclase
MKPEQQLHLFSPYLPTDRFRALLRNSDLPTSSEGAALVVDISGFTPMTTRLVVEYGPERASEELKRRLNPMFEAIAGQVFHHGGSVIRFTGDGFIAWFDDQPVGQNVSPTATVSAASRAVSAGLEMQAVMPLFKGLRLKVYVGAGLAYRWVVGHPSFGLMDVLLGPAVEAVLSLGGEAQAGQVLVHRDMIAVLRDAGVHLEIGDSGNAVILKLPDSLSVSARQHRWPAWSVDGESDAILNTVRPFVDATIRERVESGLGDYVAELRNSIPMFIQIKGVIPEQLNARDILDSYVRAAQSVITSFGGRFVSVEVGDKGSVFFAVFGAPLSFGDDAERAIRAAMALRELSNGPDNTGVERIGLSRGQLYAGTIGGEVRHEYTTVGDETNIASRLMSSAAYRQILTTSNVRNEIGPRVAFHDLPPLLVKGRELAIPVTEPISIQLAAPQHIHTGELVGREAELTQLHKAVKAVRKGYPRIVRVEGEAGIGKSRLVGELLLLATNDLFIAAGGDCVSTGRNMPYLPWRDVLLSLLSISLDLDVNEAVSQIYRAVEAINSEWSARVPLLSDVLQVPIADSPATIILEGRTRHQALFALVIDILIAISSKHALILIFEDTHWLDEVSEALLVELSRRLMVEPMPILLLLIHRPLLQTDHVRFMHQTLEEMYIHSCVRLDDLSRVAVTELLENYLNASIPPDLSRFVYDRARGNPFYAQEVIDTLVETGHIKVIGSLVFIEKNLQDTDLPKTVQTLIQARIDRLSEMDKLVLKVAAVIGREFQVRVLAKSIPVQMAYDELLNRLHTLEERDFSYQETLDPELTYLFKHAITQEVTYQSLLFAQRKQLHQAVATALEALAPDETERLAYHYARSSDKERAWHYLVAAGEKTFREYANQAALGYFTQALELAQNDQQLYEINCRRLTILLRMGDTAAIKVELPRLQELASRNEHEDWKATVGLFWANHYTQTSAWTNVITEARQAAVIAHDHNYDELLWEAYKLMRDAFLQMNYREEAESVLDMMEPIAARLDDQRGQVELHLLQIENSYRRTPQTAIERAQQVNLEAQAINDPILLASSWSLLANLYSRENNLLDALDAYRQQIGLMRQVGNRRHEGLTLLNIGTMLVNLGELSDGNAHLLDAFKILHQIGERAGEAASLVMLGVIAQHHRAYDEALAYMNRGLALQRTLNTVADIARTLFLMANVYIMKSALDEAVQALDEARHLFNQSAQEARIVELQAAYAEIELINGNSEAAMSIIAPLISRLQHRSISDLMLPGLAYWRAIQCLERCGNIEQSNQLRLEYRTLVNATISRLSPEQRDAYINRLWYRAALLQDNL